MHGLLNQFVYVDDKPYSIYIGSHCSIAHNALIHGPSKISKKTFIGFHAVIHKSIIGRNCFIGHKAVIEGVTLPDNCYVPSGLVIDSEALVATLPKMPVEKKVFNKEVVDYNKLLVQHYKCNK